jgi:hypothetical protein
LSPPAPVRPLASGQWRWVLALCLAAVTRPAVAEEKVEPPPPKWRLVPLPVYATVPNEGSTYGLMPVVLGLTPEGAIRSILAPSASWNSAVHVTGTFRYYRFPSPARAWHVIASASTRVNRSFTFEYTDRPRDPGRLTTEVYLQARRSLFYRFFGLGPDSSENDESSYVRTHTLATVRVHYNLPHRFAVGLIGQARRDWLDRSQAFPALPSTQDRFPDAPGLNGAAFVAGGLNLRLDTREGFEYSEAGVGSELSARHVEGLRGFDRFLGLLFDTRVLLPTTSRSQTAGRLYASYALGGEQLPFYYQSSLGGELRLRGFTEDRFIDRGAWEVDIEHRIRLFSTNLFGVRADWRVDPFVVAGQVFGEDAGPFDRVRAAVGVGFRALVPPNVLGRVDLAWGGEGIKAYVLLGYPF